MENIFHKLMKYCDEDYVPLHMPGHKRNIDEFVMKNPYELDITEIDGFDNLHNPTGLIMDSMKAAAQLYGAKNTFYLVNGSSVGLLTAISATVKRGDKVIVARNCHKSVYNAIYLNELYPVYVYPEYINDLGINGLISASSVDKLLDKYADIAAVIITSPTYEGIVSDIAAISNVVHNHNIPLIVDEAHGAHFHFHEAFPESALDKGADIVVQSIHKTLPAFTQTALLHVKGDIIHINKVKRYLDIYQSSSPSYILMAGIDNCMEFLKTKGPNQFNIYIKNLNELRRKIQNLKYICLFNTDDISKLVIFVQEGYLNGKQLYDILLNKYHIQLEMASLHYVIAMTSVGDKIEYYDRFIKALTIIDNSIELYNMTKIKNYTKVVTKITKGTNDIKGTKIKKYTNRISCNKYEIVPAHIIETPYKAMNADLEVVEIENSIGRVSGSGVCIYPPGIPIVFPGEMITLDIVNYIKKALALGLEVIGLDMTGLGETETGLNIKYKRKLGGLIQCLK